MNKGFAHVFLLLILTITAIGGVGYYAFINGQVKPNPESNLNQSLTPTISSSLLFFKDDRFGLSFYYPNTFEVSGDCDSGGEDPTCYERILIQDRNRTKNNHDIWFDFHQVDNPKNLSLDQWFATDTKKNLLSVKIADLQIDNNPALLFGVPITCKSASGLVVLIKNNKKIIEINYGSRTASKENLPGLSTILKTLKFSTDQKTLENNIPNLDFPLPTERVKCD